MLVGSRPKIFVVAFLPSTSAFLSRKTFGDSTDHQNVSTRSFADAIIAHDASRLSDGVHCCLQRPLCARGLNRSRGRALRRAAWPWMDDGSELPTMKGQKHISRPTIVQHDDRAIAPTALGAQFE